ncbi:MAG TPA: Ig-like domain-containing protein [Solirubrobacteraceae bacterium]|nr:Ig-like domain-containing protein [Solirubrobacteraceae bacterium]
MTRAAAVLVGLVLALAAGAGLAAPAGATTLVNETFSHGTPDNPNWLVGGLVGTNSVNPCLTAGTNTSQSPIPGCPANQPAIPAGGDPNGQGALRLTSDTGNNTGFVLYQDALPFTAGLDVTFSFYDYDTVPTSVGSGADGVSFFLADGSQPLVSPGGFGGSLGYAQTVDPFPVNGILGGYLGVGFDEWGNFGNNAEGRGTGCNQPATGLYPNYVTLRGPGTGQTGYCILDRVNVASYGAIDAPNAKTRTAAGVKRTVHIVVDPPAQAGAQILVQMDFGSGMQTIMDEPEPPNPPATFKFGFAASTGGANNIHEINATVINTILPVPRLGITKTDTGPFVVGGAGTFTLTPTVQAGSDVGPETDPVTVTDTLPAGTLSGTPTGTGWDCSASSGTTVSCTYPASAAAPIAAGTTLPSITVPVVFGPEESGIFTNVAHVTSQDNANTPQQSSASDTFDVLPVGHDDSATTDIGVPVGIPILDVDHGSLQPSTVTIISQPADGTVAWNLDTDQAIYTPNPGWSGVDTFTYTVSDAYGQQLTQTVTITVLPRAQDDSGVTPEATPVTVGVLANDLGDLDPSTVAVTSLPGHGTVSVNPTTGQTTYTPAAGFTGQDTYIYTVKDQSGQSTSATVTIDVYAAPGPAPTPPPAPHAVGHADLVVTKTVSPKVAGVGDVLTYTVTIANRGPDTADQVVGTDASRGKADILSLKPSAGTCTIQPTLQCSLGDIASGATVTVVARVRVLKPGMLSDTAAVTADGPDPDPVTDHATAVAQILPAPLTITKRASPTRVQSGAIVSFTIEVRNRSSKAVRNVSVCDRLPAGLTYVSGGTPHGTEVCWKIGSLAAKRSRTFGLRATAVASGSRVVTNLATVSAHGIASRTARATVAIVSPVPSFTG